MSFMIWLSYCFLENESGVRNREMMNDYLCLNLGHLSEQGKLSTRNKALHATQAMKPSFFWICGSFEYTEWHY